MKKHQNPSHQSEIIRLNKIIGQWQGIKKMIEGGRYCPDILSQIKATESAAKSLKTRILERHLSHCVSEALQKNSKKESAAKIQELTELLQKW